MKLLGRIWLWGSASFGLSSVWAVAEEITFSEHVAPVIYQNCVECHNPDGIGPFSLLTYEDVKRRSQQIVEVTQRGFMPPWKPDSGYGPSLIGERSLTEEEKKTLLKWHSDSHPLGDMQGMPQIPDITQGWALGEPDLVLAVPEGYTLAAEGKDIYYNFVLPIPIDDGRYVSAVEFLPESRLVIHHAVMTFDRTSWSRNKAASESGNGFAGMELGNASDPAGQFIGWTPGQVPYQSFPGTAWRLDPGTDMVLQLHMLPSGKETKIQPRIGLHFTEEAPIHQTMTLKLVDQNIDIPAGDPNYMVEESLRLPVDVEVLSLYPHAHYLGKEIAVFAQPPEGGRQWLLRINDWDCNWQSDYRFKEPLPLPAGTEIVMRYRFDNSEDNILNPNAPPKRIRFGPNSSDEMAEVAISILLKNPEDLSVLEKAYQEYRVQAAGIVRFFYDQGMSYLQMGLLEDAFKSLQVCINEDPEYAPAFFALAKICQQWEQRDRATEYFVQALSIDPANESYQLEYVRSEYSSDGVSAQLLLKEYLSKSPESIPLRLELAETYLRGNRLLSAIEILEEGLMLNENAGAVRLLLGRIYGQIGEIEKATEYFNSPTIHTGNSPEHRQIQADAFFAQALLADSENKPGVTVLLQKAIERFPQHKGALLFLSRIALLAEDLALARSYLDALVALPNGSGLPDRVFISDLPFPQGVLLLSDLYAVRDRTERRTALLKESVAYAAGRKRADWVRQLEEKLAQ